MDLWTRALRVATLAPELVVSTVLWLTFAALLPPGAMTLLLTCGPALVIALWLCRSGRAGRLVDRVSLILAGAREPTMAEYAVLAPVLRRLTQAGVQDVQWLVSRSDQAGLAARYFGRDQVAISPALIQAVQAGQFDIDEAAGALAHFAGRLKSQPNRGEVAIALWNLPWRGLSRPFARLGKFARRLPAMSFAWRLRFIVGCVAVAHSASTGRLGLATVVLLFLTVNYVMPTARRVRDARLLASEDAYVARRFSTTDMRPIQGDRTP